ncbi:MAG: 5-(carboxyamino)imidazole ribonucleotide synthase [Cyanobacteria bacterium J06641_5]
MSVKRIGIVGGGQLARMLAEAARALSLELWVQAASDREPAVALAAGRVGGAVGDAAATAKLAATTEAIAFENEFVDLAALAHLGGVEFCPRLGSLAPLLDKYHQRTFLQAAGIGVPEFIALAPERFVSSSPFGYPVVLKARRHGYDGQGTFICQDAGELAATWEQLGRPKGWMLEAFVPFERELAIMAVRDRNGDIALLPVVETKQKDGICRRVYVPAGVSAATEARARALATQLLEKLKIVGILGIELFLTTTGDVLVNEIAPRTHNSGHFSLDACSISQFTLQLQAVAGLPLGMPKLIVPGAVMVNLLGFETAQDRDYAEKRARIAALPQTYVHWYGKTASRPGRKLGHATACLEIGDRAAAVEIGDRIAALWYG